MVWNIGNDAGTFQHSYINVIVETVMNSCSSQFGIYTMGKAGHTIAQDICFFSIALSYNCTMVKGFNVQLIHLLLVNQLRAVIGGKISRWLKCLMLDYIYNSATERK